MRTIEDLVKHYSISFREGKTELQIKNFEKEYFEKQEITFNAILREIKVESTKLEIWLSIPHVREETGEPWLKDGLWHLVTVFRDISVVIDYPLSNDNFKLSSFSKGENVHVKGLINYMHHNFISIILFSIERTDRIDHRPSSTYKLPEEGSLYEYNLHHLKKIKEATEREKGQCFIATACYENFDAPEVIVLRQLRDDKLVKTLLGKLFVKFYYSVSPFFAILISKSDLTKKLVRYCFLEPIVKKLRQQNKG